MILSSLALTALLPFSTAFAPSSLSLQSRTHTHAKAGAKVLRSKSFILSVSTHQDENVNDTDTMAEDILVDQGKIAAPKLSFNPSPPEGRGKGGIQAAEPIAALEVMARIPRSLIIATCDSPAKAVAATAEMEAENFSWAADLCAATLVALFPDSTDGNANPNAKANPDDDCVSAKQSWIAGWEAGGWGTDGADLGPPEVNWGSKCVTGSLLSTGSDNDKNVFAKFRFPCHPVIFRAGTGLAMLTGADEQDSLDALLLRGKTYRGMRDALLTLVETPSDRKGSLRERRAWDVADVLSRMLARATTLQLGDEDGDEEMAFAVVPVHERLAHCDGKGENSKLVAAGDDVLLVATRDISSGEEITRDYAMAPRLDGDTSDGSLRLLLQFGLAYI